MEEIKIVEVIADGITQPRNNGTAGSALYAVPFKLSRTPSPLWAEAFVRTWNSPPHWTTMHRPGIATVEGDRVILNGTTLEEVQRTHRETLVLCVSEANRIEAEELQRRAQADEAAQRKNAAFRKDVQQRAKDIKFN